MKVIAVHDCIHSLIELNLARSVATNQCLLFGCLVTKFTRSALELLSLGAKFTYMLRIIQEKVLTAPVAKSGKILLHGVPVNRLAEFATLNVQSHLFETGTVSS